MVKNHFKNSSGRIRIWIFLLTRWGEDPNYLDLNVYYIALDSMIFQKCIGPDMFSWMRHFVVEVCAPPSAVLICLVVLYI